MVYKKIRTSTNFDKMATKERLLKNLLPTNDRRRMADQMTDGGQQVITRVFPGHICSGEIIKNTIHFSYRHKTLNALLAVAFDKLRGHNMKIVSFTCF